MKRLGVCDTTSKLRPVYPRYVHPLIYLFFRHHYCIYLSRLLHLSSPCIHYQNLLYHAPPLLNNPTTPCPPRRHVNTPRIGVIRVSEFNKVTFFRCRLATNYATLITQPHAGVSLQMATKLGKLREVRQMVLSVSLIVIPCSSDIEIPNSVTLSLYQDLKPPNYGPASSLSITNGKYNIRSIIDAYAT